jgi:arylsulfatase A-like enzyme
VSGTVAREPGPSSIRLRAFARHLLAAALLFSIAAGCSPWIDRPEHVILIVIDSLRADLTLAPERGATAMPNFARLASEGVRFEHAYAAASSSIESTTSILTGTAPLGHRVLEAGHRTRLRPLQQIFADAGYQTYAAIGHPSLNTLPTLFHEGFDRAWISETWIDENSSEVTNRVRKYLRHSFDPRRLNFVYIHYLDPHEPYAPQYPTQHPPVRDDGIDILARSGEPELRAQLERSSHHEPPRPEPQSATMLARMRSKYEAEARRVDKGIGDIIADLDRMGVLDDTLILITADHGEAFLEHGQLGHGFQLYEEQLRVPFVVYRRGHFEPEVRSDLVSGVDVAPTLLGRSSLDVPSWMQGRDLFEGEPIDRPILFATHYLNQRLWGMRSGAHKLIENRHTGVREIYDLAEDPSERNDLSQRSGDAHAALATTLAATFDALVADHATIEGAAEGIEAVPAHEDTALRTRLDALGGTR